VEIELNSNFNTCQHCHMSSGVYKHIDWQASLLRPGCKLVGGHMVRVLGLTTCLQLGIHGIASLWLCLPHTSISWYCVVNWWQSEWFYLDHLQFFDPDIRRSFFLQKCCVYIYPLSASGFLTPSLTLCVPVVSWCKDEWGGRWVGCSSLAAHPSATLHIREAFDLS
jgi:hypothetical protein